MVVFDIGGVLVRITHDWADAAGVAGVSTDWHPDNPRPINGFPALEAYQSGEIEFEAYIQELAAWSGCDVEGADRIHRSILIGEYPGVRELAQDLRSRGILTGCLSNTNAAHWEELTGDRFPVITSLERKMASHLVGMAKPDPRIYRLFAETNGVAPEKIVFFDDNLPNVEAAREAGFRAHRIDPAGDTAAQMREFLELENASAE
jgi:FMN phosphatase YigB (HAD superfamily)